MTDTEKAIHIIAQFLWGMVRRLVMLAMLYACFSLKLAAQSSEVEMPAPQPAYSLSVHSNTFAWCLALPNIGVEYAFAPRWSVEGNYFHTWLTKERAHRAYRIYGGELLLRYWLSPQGEKPMRVGHHLSLYTQLLTYDLKFTEVGTLAKCPQFGVGVAYGYTFCLDKRWSLGVALGVGVVHGVQEKYRYCERGQCDAWQETLRSTYVGPTKLTLNLSYHIR